MVVLHQGRAKEAARIAELKADISMLRQTLEEKK